ncbi:MAG: hypothetical protein H0V34_13405 [Gammaproteobacteria bacterium]|nr:hypothetical protein [Gammaproteobacteria bacterium]MBA3731020.1 hypothetical protein [Gammaproteobacteria bacterium]
MSRRTMYLIVALSLLSACAIAPEAGNALPVVDGKGIRDLGGGPFLLDFLAIKADTEDRVVLEFETGAPARRLSRVVLKIPVKNLDEGGETGVIDIYAFIGDGKVNAEDFDAGKRVAQVEAPASSAVRVDVTDAFLAAMDRNEKFIGLRLSTETDDRYFLGAIADLPDPTLCKRYGD